MRHLIKQILKEEIGGNYFYLIVTKDGRFYLSDGDDWEWGEMLVPMDGTLSYEELDKLHNPSRGGTKMYKTRERAESVLKNTIDWYNTPEERKQGFGWSERYDTYIDNLMSKFEEEGLTWDDFIVKKYYLGLIPAEEFPKL
jgi:hypothetical protein